MWEHKPSRRWCDHRRVTAADVSPYLHPGERIVWQGAPDPAVRLGPSDVFLLPFSVLWCSFAVFWVATAIATGAPFFFRIFGTFFVAVGLFFVFGRFIVKSRRKRRTAYVLTTERALVLTRSGSLDDSFLKHQPLSIRRSRTGTHVSVTFGPAGGFRLGAAAYANTGTDVFATGSLPVAFYDVTPPEPLLAALETARRAAASG